MTGGFILSACAQVQINNAEVCGDLGDLGAACFNTMNTTAREIDKPAWDKERYGELCMTVQTFADFKSEIEQLCSLSGKCTDSQKKMVSEFFDRVDAFEFKAKQ